MPNVYQYSVAAIPVIMRFNPTELSTATAFIWKEGPAYFLVTNWHNLSGRNPNTGQHLSPTLAEPNTIEVGWNLKGHLGAKQGAVHPLRDESGQPLWLVHPVHRHRVDVVALGINPPDHAEPYPINEMATLPLAVEVGQDVFILGYPFGLGQGGFPIWKRGSIASEPEMLDPAKPYVLVDTASRSGMSGSPVLRRSWGMAQLEDGSMNMGPGSSTRFIGVYSGRLHVADPMDAQLGMYWPARFVTEIIAGGMRDQ